MIACVFENTIEGFLSAVFDLYKYGIDPDVFCAGDLLQTGLDMRVIKIETQEEKADRIRRFLLNNVNVKSYQDLLYAFAGGNENKFSIIYKYFKVLFEYKQNAPYMLNDQRMINFFDLSRAVALECHRMQGFIRFSECKGGIYYANYAPDNDITQFIMPHFCNRFSSMPFIIHDVKRNIAGIYNMSNYKIFRGLGVLELEFTQEEECFLDIWNMYYNTVSVKERRNTKLMKRFMPVRYWKFLPEKKQK